MEMPSPSKMPFRCRREGGLRMTGRNSIAALLLLTSHAWAASGFNGVITKCADGDTVVVERSDHSIVKVRLAFVDCPEVKHRLRDKDQPGGQEALKYVKDNWQGKEVRVTPKGESYGRIVAEVVDAKTEKSMGLDLVSRGHAEVDQRFSKSKLLLDAESKAKAEGIGLWSSKTTPIHPWDWRKQQRVRGK